MVCSPLSVSGYNRAFLEESFRSTATQDEDDLDFSLRL